MKLSGIIRHFLNIILKGQWKYYWGLVFPKDDYYFRYFGHQYGQIKRTELKKVFSEIHNISSIHIANYFELQPGTSLEINELVILVSIARFCGAQHICEVGTFNGNTTLNLAMNLPESSITTIDLPLDYQKELSGAHSGNSNVTDRKKVGQCFLETIYEKKNIKQIYANSYHLDWNSFDKKFDLIFIDGCHQYEYVKKDSANAFAFIEKHGVIIWHDYGQHEGVSRAVDEFAEVMDIYAITGTRFAIGLKK